MAEEVKICQVVLLGDAAHTMTPVTGQGCNSGLEDAHILAGILSKATDIDEALPQYNAARLPDIRALVRLNEILAFGRFKLVVRPSIWLAQYSAMPLINTLLQVNHFDAVLSDSGKPRKLG